MGVLGTSLVVQPFCMLISLPAAGVPRLLINREAAGTCDQLPIGFRFQKEGAGNWRDVFHAGDCDGGCRALAKALGWQDDLATLIESKGAASAERAVWMQDGAKNDIETKEDVANMGFVMK